MPNKTTIFGFHAIESLLNNSPEVVLKIIIQKERKDKRINDLMQIVSKHNIPFLIKDRLYLDKISRGEVHQGVITEVILPPTLNEKSLFESINNFNQNLLILILDSIQDNPHQHVRLEYLDPTTEYYRIYFS